jgi:pimeloyl-ACP methyl ester carboxylesterase
VQADLARVAALAYSRVVPTLGKLRYIEAPASGSRPHGALVLLHAFPLNARMWEPQMALAANGWRIIAPQLRGFDGGGDDPPAESVDDFAGDVIDLLDTLHLKDAVIGGLSMGGYVSFALLRLAPAYISGLILADTRPQADSPEGVEGRQRMLQKLTDAGPAGIVDEMLPRLLGETTRASRPEVAERVRTLAVANPADAIAGGLRALMTRPDSTGLLGAIRCPTLIVVGEEDVITPPELSDGMHRAIAGSDLVKIPRAGHLSSLEQPESFNAALAGFLAHRL